MSPGLIEGVSSRLIQLNKGIERLGSKQEN